MVKHECPIFINCSKTHTPRIEPQGCKDFPKCDLFLNILEDYCKKISTFNHKFGLHKTERIFNCDKCKYVELCKQSGFKKFIREKMIKKYIIIDNFKLKTERSLYDVDCETRKCESCEFSDGCNFK